MVTTVAPDPVAVVERLAAIDRRVSAVDVQLLVIHERLATINQSLLGGYTSDTALFSQLGGWFAAFGARALGRPLASTSPAASSLS